MVAVLDALRPTEHELEQLWRALHSAWVRASEQLAHAEDRYLGRVHGNDSDDLAAAMVHVLRMQERQSRSLLAQYETRLHAFRSRAAAFRPRYA
jgi:hypothetical protein